MTLTFDQYPYCLQQGYKSSYPTFTVNVPSYAQLYPFHIFKQGYYICTCYRVSTQSNGLPKALIGPNYKHAYKSRDTAVELIQKRYNKLQNLVPLSLFGMQSGNLENQAGFNFSWKQS